MKAQAQTQRRTIALDSDKTVAILEHHRNAREARLAAARQGLKPEEIAERAGLHPTTVYRFLGMAAHWTKPNTIDPRTSTTIKIFQALGYDVVLRPRVGG